MRSCERSVPVAPAEGAGWPAEAAGHQDAPSATVRPGVVIAVSLAAEPSLVADVRHSVRAVVAICGSPELADRLELVASELVSNAVRHGGGHEVSVLMKVQGGTALLEVADADGSSPVPRPAGAADEDGRGLALIGALADAWGWHPRTHGGKTVWASLALDKAGAAV